MSQHDYVIDNGSGAAVRADINSALQALASVNAGAAEPATTYAYMLWADTTTGLLKMRDGSNTTWVTLGDFTAAHMGHLTTYFPSGTKMVFYQISPPTGWTKDTSNNDKALRVVSGAGGGTGGTHGLSSPPSTAHTHDLGNHTHTVVDPTTGSHTLTIAEIPAHTHTCYYGTGPTAGGGGEPAGNSMTNTGSTGGGGGHTHPGGGTVTSSIPSTNTSGSSSPTAFAPQYIDVIVAIKD